MGLATTATAESSGVLAGIGPIGALGLVVLLEAGVPVPVPSDLVMLFVGERAASGSVALWVAFVGLEVATLVGTSAFFFAARGPARGLVRRVGPRIGLSEDRMKRLADVVERRGVLSLAIGRATPGMRTASVVAASLSALPARRALPPLLIGASVFVQLHLVLGYVLGSAASAIFERAAKPALLGAAAFAAIGLAFWFIRKRRAGLEEAAHDWTEACCPVCLALGAVVPSVVKDLSEATR